MALGILEVGVVGQGIGSYMALHASREYFVKAAFCPYPSHPEVVLSYSDETEQDLYSPGLNNGLDVVYFGNTPQEGDSTRPAGMADIMLDNVRTLITTIIHVFIFSLHSGCF